MPSLRSRPWVLGVANLAAVLVAYFSVPVDVERSALWVVTNLGLTLVGLALVIAVLVREARLEVRSGRTGLRSLQLLLLFEIVFVAFALVYYTLSVHAPQQMSGIETRLDALYFTAVTMATVGYGEIHPAGQIGRAVATVHIVFNVVFLAAFARLLAASFVRNAREGDGRG